MANIIMADGKGALTLTLLGETPVMDNSRNVSIDDLCTIDIGDLDFIYLLFLSKDKTGYKFLPYFSKSTTSNIGMGLVNFANYYKNNIINISFNVASRESVNVKTLSIGHARATGTSGSFYLSRPQKFDIYAVSFNP